MKKVSALKTIDESLAKGVSLISAQDRESISENFERSQRRLATILTGLNETKMDADSEARLQEEMVREATKLERLMILEGTADKDFFEIQKNFRSMVRAANVLIKWFPDSAMSSKMEALRTEGIELLNGLYDHIKSLEGGASRAAQMDRTLDKSMSSARDRFMKVYTDFAVVFRGMMAVADLFSEDPATVTGYTELKGIFDAFEEDYQQLGREALITACQVYDGDKGTQNADPRLPHGIPEKKKGMMGKMFGKSKGTAQKVQHAIVAAIQSHSPGFAKIVPPADVVSAIMSRTLDQLRAYFQQFNDYVAADVDVNFLLQVSKNPRTIGSLFKGVWDALGAGTMKSLH